METGDINTAPNVEDDRSVIPGECIIDAWKIIVIVCFEVTVDMITWIDELYKNNEIDNGRRKRKSGEET